MSSPCNVALIAKQLVILVIKRVVKPSTTVYRRIFWQFNFVHSAVSWISVLRAQKFRPPE